MPFDRGSGHTWPALEVRCPDPQAGDLIQAFLLDYDVAAIDDNLSDISRVFFHSAGDRDGAADGLRRQFPHVQVHAIDVPDEDWAARSQAGLRAIQVGSIVVAPPWDVAHSGIRDSGLGIRDSGFGNRDSRFGIRDGDPIVVVIQPSMGFGTGHHATTRLCLVALQQLELGGTRVIDVGTGSGVLAIAASRLGAGTVLAIDDDGDATQAARDSLALNPEARVTITLVDFRIPDPESRIPGQFDVVVANLTGGLLMTAADRLRLLAAPSGRLVLSGFMDHEEGDVLRAFAGCVVESRAHEDEWMCVVTRT